MDINKGDLLYQIKTPIVSDVRKRYIVFHKDFGYLHDFKDDSHFDGGFSKDIYEAIRWYKYKDASYFAERVNRVLESDDCTVIEYKVTYELIIHK